jgi:uncharacterized protein (TIGR02265 family)
MSAGQRLIGLNLESDPLKVKGPVIKGLFVNSHIKALEKAKGEAGKLALQKLYKKNLHFGNLEDVPVREEVALIEATLQIMQPTIAKSRLAYEAGRLHFRNFTTTPYGKILFSSLPRDFKRMMMNSRYIAQHVFKGVKFASEDLGPKAVRVTMQNNDYPLEHFRGLFAEWMKFFKLTGTVDAKQDAKKTYTYTMRWQ